MPDTSSLKPANENPWYVLMTLYGEQEGEEIDPVLHQRNRNTWNMWASHALSEEQCLALAKIGFDLPDRNLWSLEAKRIKNLHEKVMIERNGKDFAYPGFPVPFENVEMRALRFKNHLIASKFLFATISNFESSTFSEKVNFRSAVFAESTFFTASTFLRDANFIEVAFDRDALFGEATTFVASAMFRHSKFNGDAWFRGVRFNGFAWFASVRFIGRAAFEGGNFSENADFQESKFGGGVWFEASVFAKKAIFDSVLFDGLASFRSASFCGDAMFRSVVFSGFSYFNLARFGESSKKIEISFGDSQFLKPASFYETVFQSTYPDFHGAVLHEKTNFTANPSQWPNGPELDVEQSKASCAVIRHTLGKQGLPEAEHFFFRREMGFAAQIGPWWQRLPYQVFGFFSDYGHSIERPFWSMFFLWYVPGWIFALQQWTYCDCRTDFGILGRSAALSLANLLPALGFQKLWFDPEFLVNLPGWIKVMAGAQTVFALPLLFFVLLGFRTRFRMR